MEDKLENSLWEFMPQSIQNKEQFTFDYSRRQTSRYWQREVQTAFWVVQGLGTPYTNI